MMLRENLKDGRSVPFRQLMELEKLGDGCYRSCTKGFRPGAPSTVHRATYGGHVYTQAVYAASHTVDTAYVVNSVTGYFMLAGDPEYPFIYYVRTIRDGRSFCVRSVEVTQEHIKGTCFTCTCSFKKSENSPLEFQKHLDLKKRFGSLLDRKPDDQPDAPSTESPWFRESKEAWEQQTPFPGLVSKKVDMDAWNARRAPLDRRQILLYKVIGDMPPVSEAPNLHACAHLYASDRNSLYAIPAHLDIVEHVPSMASLSHTVIFHANAGALNTIKTDTGEALWFIQEAWITRLADGRGLHESTLHSMDTGVHLATTMQDGLTRIAFKTEEDKDRAKKRIESGKSKI